MAEIINLHGLPADLQRDDFGKSYDAAVMAKRIELLEAELEHARWERDSMAEQLRLLSIKYANMVGEV